MVKNKIDKEFEVTAAKIEKYGLIDAVGDPGEELDFINKSKVNDMNADINHIDIGYLRLIYKRIKVLENGWILCGVDSNEYTDILDSELNPLYKVAATFKFNGTNLGLVEKIIDIKIRENEDIARIFNNCGDDLDDNGVKTVIVGEYSARDTLIGMTEILRITRNNQDIHYHKYHLETSSLFDDYGQEISGIDFSDCVLYSVIPVERPIGIANIYTVQTYNFDTNKVVSYIGIEQYGVIRIIGKYSLGSATRSIGEASVFYILNREKDKIDSNEVESNDNDVSESNVSETDKKEDKKHLSTALVLKFKFESIEDKINNIDYRRVQFDGIEKVLTVE